MSAKTYYKVGIKMGLNSWATTVEGKEFSTLESCQRYIENIMSTANPSTPADFFRPVRIVEPLVIHQAEVPAVLLADAAPELLQALTSLTATARTFRGVPKTRQEWGPLDDEALDAAFAAIAKATGKEVAPEAHAKLLAASPELLEALRAVVNCQNYAELDEQRFPVVTAEFGKALALAVAGIAKAEGKVLR